MNKKIFFSIAMLFVATLTKAAILRVNNNPNVTGANIYSNAQAAHDAANAGDTIHLEPAAFGNYGNLNVSKKITLISTGDFLAQNPNEQASLNTGYCGNIYLQTGSENSVISAKASGIIYVWVSNIIVTHTSCVGLYVNNGQYGFALANIMVSKCVMQYCLIYDNYNDNSIAITDVLVNNNIINSYFDMNGMCSATISNNIIISFGGYCLFRNSTLSNNILYHTNYNFQFSNCTGSNNIENNTFIPTNLGSNNISNVDFSTVFQNWGAFNGDNYQLNPTYTNQTVGPFAGADPYKPACQPGVPAIYQLSVPSTSGNNLPIQVSTKSN
ncbi:MAG: hypothetical protein JNM44_06740 [Chitinophagaceae bacterium]|nr:hypothetical protein [Chitinophagaceae bacterium]